jgi:hypothetical protein
MSHRGTNILHKEIFLFNEPAQVIQINSKQGRDQTLDKKRNECLVDRYFYIGRTTKMSYIPLLQKVAAEFFISTYTAGKVITKNLDLLHQLKNDSPSRNYFAKKWPHLVWE